MRYTVKASLNLGTRWHPVVRDSTLISTDDAEEAMAYVREFNANRLTNHANWDVLSNARIDVNYD